MKIICDVNVLVSSTYWTGESNKILEMVDEGKISNITSHEIMADYVEACNDEDLMDKIERKELFPLRTVEKITSMSILVHPKEKLEIVKDDPDDDKIIEAAVEGNCDYIVSKDKKHLLVMNEFRGIKIISPKEFLDLIRKN